MKRLVDHGGPSDALALEAARLVQAAGTFEPEPGLKTRIRARLLEREAARPRKVRSWVVATVLVSLLAIAGATVVRTMVRDDPPPPPPAPRIEHVLVAQPAPAAVPPAPQAPPPPPVTPPPVVHPSPPHRVQPPRAPAESEALLVLQATRALHTAHDPVRALALLDDYLARYPHGTLAEESLALAIEAASARGDGSAAAYAQTYLERFPTGRFVAAARTALKHSRGDLP